MPYQLCRVSGRKRGQFIGQKRDEVTEHMARAREAVQQQQLRCIRRPRFAIEDLEAVHIRDFDI